MRKVFGQGGMRLFLLMLLDEQPRHGYDLIRLVEDRFSGMYTPSAGTVYPRLQSLEEEGLIEHDEMEGRKVYRLTEAGRRELTERRSELEDLQARAVDAARLLAGSIREEVQGSVRDLRHELRNAMRDAKRGHNKGWPHRYAGPDAAYDDTGRGGPFRDPGESGPEPGSESRGSRLELRALKADLEAFVSDVMAAARELPLDRDGVRAARDALLDARQAVVDSLSS
jgi:DNA-binding PadR family transcriptional regulator